MPTSAKGVPTRLVAMLMGIGAASYVTITASNAAFDGPPRTVPVSQSHVIGVTDDHRGDAMLGRSAMLPGDAEQTCITVTSQTDTEIRLWATTEHRSADDLGRYLRVSIEEVSPDRGDDCGRATMTAVVFAEAPLSATSEALTAKHHDWHSGRPAFASHDTERSRTYRVTTTLQDTDVAQGLDTSATLTWGTAASTSGHS